MTIFVFGNPDVELDALPLRILPRLQKAFPDISFEVKDPNEEWDVPEELIAIDTVVGIDAVRVFDDLAPFLAAPRVSLHDFDAFANLSLLKKLGRLKQIKIIGLPPTISDDEAFEAVRTILSANLP